MFLVPGCLLPVAPSVLPYLQGYNCCGSLGLLKGGPGTWKPAAEKAIYVDMSVHCGGLLRCGEPGNCAETRVCVCVCCGVAEDLGR